MHIDYDTQDVYPTESIMGCVSEIRWLQDEYWYGAWLLLDLSGSVVLCRDAHFLFITLGTWQVLKSVNLNLHAPLKHRYKRLLLVAK